MDILNLMHKVEALGPPQINRPSPGDCPELFPKVVETNPKHVLFIQYAVCECCVLIRSDGACYTALDCGRKSLKR